MERDSGVQPAAAAPWLALAGAIGASQVGQALLKAGATGLPEAGSALGALIAQLLRWPTLIGLGFYGGGVLLYVLALRRIPMSVALPCTAISFVAATAVGVLAFGEPFGGRHVAGLALICAGVVLLARTVRQAGKGIPDPMLGPPPSASASTVAGCCSTWSRCGVSRCRWPCPAPRSPSSRRQRLVPSRSASP